MISGRELKQEREAAGVRVADVARELGVSRQYVSKVEGYPSVTGDTLALFRGAIEATRAKKEGRQAVKTVPLFCPICEEPTAPPHASNLGQHLNDAHPDRAVRVSSTHRASAGVPMNNRRAWITRETPSSVFVIFADYPYALLPVDRRAHKFEPVEGSQEVTT